MRLAAPPHRPLEATVARDSASTHAAPAAPEARPPSAPAEPRQRRALTQVGVTPPRAPQRLGTAEKLAVRTVAAVKHHQIPVAPMLAAIRTIAQRDPVFARLLEVFDRGQYTFSMDRRPELRMQLLETGFKNLYELQGKTDGAQDFDQRAHVDSLYLGLHDKAFAKLPATEKAKCLYLTPALETGIQTPPTVFAEGTGDTWVFDRAKVAPQALFVVGDTYDRALFGRDLVDDWKHAHVPPDAKLAGDHVGDYLLPLEWLALSIPYYHQQVEEQNQWRFSDPESPRVKAMIEEEREFYEGYLPPWAFYLVDLTAPDFGDAFFARFPELEPFRDTMLMRPHGNYSEVDVFGPLDASKVKALVYRSSPPTPEEQAKLTALGIEVIDGRAPPVTTPPVTS